MLAHVGEYLMAPLVIEGRPSSKMPDVRQYYLVLGFYLLGPTPGNKLRFSFDRVSCFSFSLSLPLFPILLFSLSPSSSFCSSHLVLLSPSLSLLLVPAASSLSLPLSRSLALNVS